MPIELVSVKVREHPHEERTSSGVVPCTAAGIVRQNERMKEFEGGPPEPREARKRDRDEQTNHPRVTANNEN